MMVELNLPQNWKRLRLDEVFQIARGGSPRPIIDFITDSKDGYNWIKIGDTKNIDKYIYKTKQKIIKAGLKKSLLVKENDFILSNSMSFGKPYIMKTEGCIHDGWLLLRKLKENISVDFMYYVLSSDFIKTQFTSKAAGSTVQNLNIKLVETVIALIPPLPEQQKIAEILSTVDEKIVVIDQQITETQELKKGLMQRLLTKGIGHTEFKDSPLGRIPESWEVVKFEDILRKGKGSLGYGILQPGEGVSQGINMVRTVDLTEVGRANTKILKVPENISNTSPTTVLEGGEVLLSVMGTLGRTFLVPNEWRGWNVNRALAVIRTNEKIDNNFLCHFFRSPYFKRVIDKQSLGSAQIRINLNDLRKYDVPLPSLCEQIHISSNLSLFDDKLEVLLEKKTHYQELKQGLMQQLLTGKIRVKV